ncbi:PilN domain-containing protein [Neorhizobium sp. Rsf11]|uniref:PilN domain-containing protein n=2 Tax=Neorhizobium TaxID=1525371 RepID=A0ABV0MCZ5_9HYPH|nr:PilN domain-containing protein [Neorhizobium petrolearium]MCC2613767.1 PilN domain-containing protein [Neorhizobium petrolearium]WGI72077.1 PilN domain-containing protein [Neorhizobium petrolearium]
MRFVGPIKMSRIRDFLDWWSGELTDLFELLSNCAAKNFRALFKLRDAGDVGSPAVDTERSSFRRPVQFFPDQSIVFGEQFLKLPSAAQRLPFNRSIAVASALLSEKTPFTAQEVHIIPGFVAGSGAHFYVIKKSVIDPSLTQLQVSGTKIRRFGIRDGHEIHWISSRVLETLHPVFHHICHWRNGLLTAFAILLVTCGATYAHVFLKYSAAQQELAAAVEVKRSEALEIRKLLDRQQKSVSAVEAARKGKVQAVPVVRVWEELTRVLPDDAWLTDVSVDGDTMTIIGFAAQSAASLIATLDASDLFSQPSFISPVVRIPGQAGERFEIRLRIEAA